MGEQSVGFCVTWTRVRVLKNAKIEAIEVTLLLRCVRGVVSADRVPFFESFK